MILLVLRPSPVVVVPEHSPSEVIGILIVSLVSLSIRVQCCTFAFVPFETIFLKSSDNYAAGVTLWSPSENDRSLYYTRYSMHVPVTMDPLVRLFLNFRGEAQCI